MGGLACLPENEYGVDALRPPSQESVVADRLRVALAGLADALQATVAVFEGRGRTLRAVSSAIRGASLPSLTDTTFLASRWMHSALRLRLGAAQRGTLFRLHGAAERRRSPFTATSPPPARSSSRPPVPCRRC
jgi:hypothetical protein